MDITRNRELFQQFHGVAAPPLMITDFCLQLFAQEVLPVLHSWTTTAVSAAVD